jgi:hypothetical protein
MRLISLTLMIVVSLCSTVNAAARDYFSETVKDFGTTPRGPVLVHYFVLRNTSSQPVVIGSPRVSCGCVSATVLKSQLAPGEISAVAAFMDTRRIPQAGVQRTVTIYVPFLAPILEEVQLRVQAIARDDLVITPDSLNFGTVRKGQGGTASVRLSFYNDPNWQILQAKSSGAYVHPKVALLHRQGNQVTFEITATLDADCPVGNWVADVWLQTSAPGLERLRVPVTVTVVAPIAVNPESVNFGEIRLGAPVEQRIILQGSRPFRIREIQGGDPEISVSPAGDDSRPVQVLSIRLTATKPGIMTKTLTVVTDHPEQASVSIAVAASAVSE